MLTLAIRLLGQEKWSGKAPKVIEVYREAILMHVLRFYQFTPEMIKKLAIFQLKLPKMGTMR